MEDGTGDALPEEATEVLYINNLNERIKLEGERQQLALRRWLSSRADPATLLYSHEAVIDDAVQGVRQGAGSNGSPQHQDEGASIRDAGLKGCSSKGGQGGQGIPTIRQANGEFIATGLQRLPSARPAELMFVLSSLQQLTFARTRSDALVKKVAPEEMDQHKEERLKRKSEPTFAPRAGSRRADPARLLPSEISRRDNPLRRKHLAQKEAAKKGESWMLPPLNEPS